MNPTHHRKVNLVPLVQLDTETQLKIRDIRNEDSVRKAMYTDHIIGINEHLGWINRLKQDNRQIVFAVTCADYGPVGVVSVNAIDQLHKKADWAYYLTEHGRGGLGSALEYAFINFIFDTLGLEKLNCEVIEGNDVVVKIHKRFLFKEEGFRESNIIKKGVRIGVHFLGLQKEDWTAGRETLYAEYKNSFDRFCVEINWNNTDSFTKKHPIDEIEMARAKNNLNWMSILRIAIEKSPDNAKAIISEIKKIDEEISELTKELIS